MEGETLDPRFLLDSHRPKPTQKCGSPLEPVPAHAGDGDPRHPNSTQKYGSPLSRGSTSP